MALTRGARIVISTVIVATLVSAAAVAGIVMLATRGPAVPDGSVLWLRLPAELAERRPDDLLAQLGGPRATLSSVVGALRKAAADERIRTVVLAPSPQPAPWATAQEIRGAVEAFRASGKRIVGYLEYGSGQAYYLAAACDEVFLAPTSPLDLIGVTIYELFARDALDKIGAYPDMLHAGDFKTAANIYTETTFTPAHREMDEALARDFYDQLVIGIASGRGLPVADVQALIDDGPFLGDDAVARGLVDGLLYEDELLAAGCGRGRSGRAAVVCRLPADRSGDARTGRRTRRSGGVRRRRHRARRRGRPGRDGGRRQPDGRPARGP